MDKKAQWWRDKAPRFGQGIIDNTLRGNDDWARLLASGREELRTAIARSGLRTGKELSCLEVGCGVGRLTFALADHFGVVVGLDVCPAFIAEARAHNDQPNVHFEVGDGRSLAAAGKGMFDTIFCYEVFHYVPFDIFTSYSREALARLNLGGQFVFECNVRPPTLRSQLSHALRTVFYLVGVRSWRGWPTDPGFHRISHTANDITKALTAAGFRMIRVNIDNPSQAWFVAQKFVARAVGDEVETASR
jgi:SAM-dependent methyltransferase